MRRAFTLTELMIVISIMAILVGLGLSAMTGATNMAREHRAGAMIDKIDTLIMERYEGYRTRTVPVKIPVRDVNGNFIPPRAAAVIRLNAIRDLMRVELPDRVSDVVDPQANLTAVFPTIQPALCLNGNLGGIPPAMSLQASYRRTAARHAGPNWATTWTTTNQGSECLYLILATMRDGDKQALDYFDATEIGDTDGDGMLEILDGWGQPIEFVRWAPGYCEQPGPDLKWGAAGMDDDGNGTADDVTEAGWVLQPGQTFFVDDIILSDVQTRNYVKAPDPFDPVKVDSRWSSANPPYALYPLLVSGGIDRQIGLLLDFPAPLRYAATNPPNDPYCNNGGQIGDPIGITGNVNWHDNITNHSRRDR